MRMEEKFHSFNQSAPWVVSISCDPFCSRTEGRRKEKDDTWEDDGQFFKRMGGLARLYGAIVQTVVAKGKDHPCGPNKGWQMIADILRLGTLSEERIGVGHLDYGVMDVYFVELASMFLIPRAVYSDFEHRLSIQRWSSLLSSVETWNSANNRAAVKYIATS